MPRLSDDLTDGAGLYVLGVLEPEERAVLARRMTAEPGLRDAVEAWSQRLAPLHAAMPPLAPPPGAWATIQARLGLRDTPHAARRPADGVWLNRGPGIELRLLHVDPLTGVRSAVMRMAAGSRLPEHEHDQLEECVLVAGRAHMGGEDYAAGDYVLARVGSDHPPIRALEAATLLLHWSPGA